MGRVMTRVLSETPDMQVIAGVDVNPGGTTGDCPVYSSLTDVKETPDILIDFSHHSCLEALLAYGLRKHVPLLICTTGFSAEQKRQMAEASRNIPILHSGNMSLGVNLMLSLARQAAAVLHDGFDVEIVEKHHNQKVDSPSGTALMIADAVNSGSDDALEYVYGRRSRTEKRQKAELGIHSIRGGAIVGEHSLIFAGQGEVVEINHTALSRDVFAYGALEAARFLVGKAPAMYSMKDVVEGGA